VKDGAGREMACYFALGIRLPRKSQSSFTYCKFATSYRRPFFPSEKGMLWTISAAKFEPVILDTRGQHANHYTTEAALFPRIPEYNGFGHVTKRLVTRLSQRKHEVENGTVNEGLVVDMVSSGHVLSHGLSVLPYSVSS
jgi:hypothetical protein